MAVDKPVIAVVIPPAPLNAPDTLPNNPTAFDNPLHNVDRLPAMGEILANNNPNLTIFPCVLESKSVNQSTASVTLSIKSLNTGHSFSPIT